MAEYIERERAIQKVKNVIATEWFRGNYEAIGPLQRVVDVQLGRMTAADVAPVVHGRYVGVQEVFCCSVCWYTVEEETPFCPNCGAKMDEVSSDE